jgi:hypothetical protein
MCRDSRPEQCNQKLWRNFEGYARGAGAAVLRGSVEISFAVKNQRRLRAGAVPYRFPDPSPSSPGTRFPWYTLANWDSGSRSQRGSSSVR